MRAQSLTTPGYPGDALSLLRFAPSDAKKTSKKPDIDNGHKLFIETGDALCDRYCETYQKLLGEISTAICILNFTAQNKIHANY